eukprot:TRINITY_DN38593_c0_g1_i3.p2 TRINITY_DN38593_c0_g1~~TRINITY_DN38593_c0_g1_i3.p2  ORF type:complete len:149 (+),score=3.00 TRINITY_DN38593_c0_g1_i3:342-788(+)
MHQEVCTGGWVDMVSWHCDGVRAAVASDDNKLRLVCSSSGEILWTAHHGDRLRSIGWSPCFDIVATVCDDQDLRLLDGRTGRSVLSRRCGSETTCLCWSPCGRHVLVGTQSGAVHLFNVSTGKDDTVVDFHVGIIAVAWGAHAGSGAE